MKIERRGDKEGRYVHGLVSRSSSLVVVPTQLTCSHARRNAWDAGAQRRMRMDTEHEHTTPHLPNQDNLYKIIISKII